MTPMMQSLPQQQESPLPPLGELLRRYDPKQLQMLSQALPKLIEAYEYFKPKPPPPSPQERAMQPGPFEQLAALDLQRRRQAMMQQQQQGPAPMMAMQQQGALPMPMM